MLKYKMELSIINKIARENIVKKLKSNNCLITFITLPTHKKSSMRDFKQILTLTNSGVLRLNNKQLMNFNSSANTT